MDSNPGNNQDSTASAQGGGQKKRIKYDYTFKMITVGDKATGKTCCITRYTNGSFSEQNVATLGVAFTNKPLQYKDKQIKL